MNLTNISPFNAMKSLYHKEHFQAIANNFNDVPPPVTVEIDPSNYCNQNCIWCNSKGYRQGVGEGQLIDTRAFIELIVKLKAIGTQAISFIGGGEPTTHPGLKDMLYQCKKCGMKCALTTNGICLCDDNDLKEAVVECCDWISISVDAGTDIIYRKLRDAEIGRGLKDICNLGVWLSNRACDYKKLSIGYKFLICYENHHEILAAANLAKFNGFAEFYARPVYWGKPKLDEEVRNLFLDRSYQETLKEVEELSSNDFSAIVNTTKFDNLWIDPNKARCLSTAMMVVFGADGYIHRCCEKRGDRIWKWNQTSEDLIGGHKWTKFSEWWFSDEHCKQLREQAEYDVSKCPRCRYSKYNEIAEAVIKNSMNIEFL